MSKIQVNIDDTFKENFGQTPLNERLKDIQNEFFELMKWNDVKHLKEEAGDLLCSLIQLHTESGWDIEENVECTLDKINRRTLQYKSLGRKTKVAIFGGAFNPITKGHIQTAQFVLNTSGQFDEVWLMPAFKHMAGKEMESVNDRLNMCHKAAQIDARIKVFDYEIKNELAGETYNLFKRLLDDDKYKDNYNFSMIIGLDNANGFDKWVNFEELERLVRFVVVPRKGVERDQDVTWYLKEPHIFLNKETDIAEISSSEVRTNILRNPESILNISDKYMDRQVLNYINEHNLYKS